jgi:hypothetical protein
MLSTASSFTAARARPTSTRAGFASIAPV